MSLKNNIQNNPVYQVGKNLIGLNYFSKQPSINNTTMIEAQKTLQMRMAETGYSFCLKKAEQNTAQLKQYQTDRNIPTSGITAATVGTLFGKGGVNYESITNFYSCSPYGDNVTYLNCSQSDITVGRENNTLTEFNENINSYVRHYGMLNNGIMPLPVNPTEVTEQVTSNWASTTIPGRSADYLHYTNNNNRSINFSLKLHVDMGEIVQVGQNGSYRSGIDIESFVNFLQALCYPNYSGSGILPPVCKLVIENVIDARVVFNSVGITKSGPMRKYISGNRSGQKSYTIYDCNVSVIEMPTKILTADSMRNR